MWKCFVESHDLIPEHTGRWKTSFPYGSFEDRWSGLHGAFRDLEEKAVGKFCLFLPKIE